jgi:4F5 protein related disordered region
MSRGNQREIDRQRAQKKQDDKLKAAGRVSSVVVEFAFTSDLLLFETLIDWSFADTVRSTLQYALFFILSRVVIH